ncbi:ankyrin repeat domain-containing protein [Acidovorax sp. GBBC 3334]|uniref:ankyrin repeat domain-containing protein n=1 Tax=unclassified Acidovorax TaxID=2684926 RepID=UPI002302A726|nr:MULTISPECIES: ankyrin repeat domain-containing protein [unclassified Acidovorax]MDA8456844.1 ankyrin repeat domain-containing protein [Acidovorax sp. GBBC 3334]MDA8520332.1 ankyrin repeat domain-containing protein [Acidovorax sp. NCPPB 4044]
MTPTLSRRVFVSSIAVAAAGLCSACAHAGAYDDFFTSIVRDEARDITALIRRGFDPNTRSAKGEVGLTLALQQGSMQAFNALMAAPGIKVETRNAKDESPLMIACLRGQVAAARALIAKDADVNKTGWTPLHYAASGTTDRQLELAQMLIEQSAYIDAESPNGTTPLMMAVSYGRADVARFLLEQGADPTIKNQVGLTAADFARRAARQDMADLVAEAIRRRQPQQGKW